MVELIAAYRNRGHLMADIDPLRLDKTRFRSHPDLDVNTTASPSGTWTGCSRSPGSGANSTRSCATCSACCATLTAIVGVEYTHPRARTTAVAPRAHRGQARQAHCRRTEVHPVQAQRRRAFETFLQTKYVGQKRFSLEGAEAVIPMMDSAIDQAAEHGLDEVVIGMPHRGRLNVLANIIGQALPQIFSEFEGNINPSFAHGSGDVKYHLGSSGSTSRCSATTTSRCR